MIPLESIWDLWRGIALGAGITAASVAIGWAIGRWTSSRPWSP